MELDCHWYILSYFLLRYRLFLLFLFDQTLQSTISHLALPWLIQTMLTECCSMLTNEMKNFISYFPATHCLWEMQNKTFINLSRIECYEHICKNILSCGALRKANYRYIAKERRETHKLDLLRGKIKEVNSQVH